MRLPLPAVAEGDAAAGVVADAAAGLGVAPLLPAQPRQERPLVTLPGRSRLLLLRPPTRRRASKVEVEAVAGVAAAAGAAVASPSSLLAAVAAEAVVVAAVSADAAALQSARWLRRERI